MRKSLLLILPALLLLAGCSTNQRHTISHERMVQAAIYAVVDEAHVHPDQITRTDSAEEGGTLTVLESAYKQYSKIEARIDSREKHSSCPELQVRITSDGPFYTRHKEWEQRIQEVVCLKINAKQHGEESKPTALPPAEPKFVQPEKKG